MNAQLLHLYRTDCAEHHHAYIGKIRGMIADTTFLLVIIYAPQIDVNYNIEHHKYTTGRTSLMGDIDLADAEESPAGHIKEQNLNNFMAQNKEQFTPGFLLHLE